MSICYMYSIIKITTCLLFLAQLNEEPSSFYTSIQITCALLMVFFFKKNGKAKLNQDYYIFENDPNFTLIHSFFQLQKLQRVNKAHKF